MSNITVGAVDSASFLNFTIENIPQIHLDPKHREAEPRYGIGTLRESIIGKNQEFCGLKPPAGPEGALLLPGVCIVEVDTITADEAVGLTLIIHDSEPGPATPQGHYIFSEVSVEFMEGPLPAIYGDMGEPAGLDEIINQWRLPGCGIWRIRAYGDYDFEAAGGFISEHPDAIDAFTYMETDHDPESLPCQLKLEFWREKTLRDAIHKPKEAGDELVVTPCTDYMIGATPEEIAKRYE